MEQIEALIRSLTLLLAAYEPVASVDVSTVDSVSFAAGFRAGARSAYADAVCRLQELRAKAPAA